ncbi:MAG: leucine-rich repeat protein [Rikenellaceae bacterium]
MKKFIYIFSLLLAFSVASCTDLYELDGAAEQNATGVYLADIDGDNYPSGYCWTILDEEANFDDFSGLTRALSEVFNNSGGAKIELIFPNLLALPDAPEGYDIGALTSLCLKSVTLSKATYIGDKAFALCRYIEEVNLPKALELGDNVFNICNNLTSISMPELTSLGYCDFIGCNKVETMEVNADYFKFGGEALSNANSTHLYAYLSDGTYGSVYIYTSSISECAFYGCSIASIYLPNITTLANYTFLGVDNLQAIYLATNDNVKFESISKSTFSGCDTESISLTLGSDCGAVVDGTYFTFDGVSYGPFKSIEGGVTEPTYKYLANFSATSYPTDTDTWVIEDSSATTPNFKGLSDALVALKSSDRKISLEFPNLIAFPEYAIFGESDVNYADYEMSALISVTATTATLVNAYAFSGCKNLSSVTLDMVGRIETGAFKDCSSLSSLTLEKTSIISSYAFAGCAKLTEVSIPNIILLDAYTFYGCESLTSLSAPNIVAIYEQALSGCSSITSLSLENVTSIGANAFKGCSGLTSIKLATTESATLTSLDAAAFEGVATGEIDLIIGVGNASCVSNLNFLLGSINTSFKSITVLDIEGNTVELSNIEYTLESLSKYNYPESSTWRISDTTISSEHLSNIRAALVAAADHGYENIHIDFPYLTGEYPDYPESTVTGFQFAECVASISMPYVTKIGANAFSACEGLKSIYIPSVTEVAEEAFVQCASLSEVSADKLQTIGEKAFYNTGLNSISLPSAETLGVNAFGYSTSLTEINLPEATTIDAEAFYRCNIKELELLSAKSIGVDAFNSNSSMISINLPALESLDWAFDYCTSIESVSVNEEYFMYENGILYDKEATRIAAVFNNCVGSEVEIPATVTTIPESAFYNNTTIITLSAPGVTTLEKEAFLRCSSVATMSFPALKNTEDGSLYCSSLTELTISTDGQTLDSFSTDTFVYVVNSVSQNINLSIGTANSQYLDQKYSSYGEYLTIGGENILFNKITQIK